MFRRSIHEAASLAGGVWNGSGAGELVLAGVSTDTRTIAPGNLFIPLDVGARFDGHDFVAEAFARGAGAALWQRDRVKPESVQGLPLIEVDDTMTALQQLSAAYLAQLEHTRVVAITGSNGKTTTKDMTAAVLAEAFRVHKTSGNLNSHIGLPLTILQIDETVDMLVLEMGMRGRGEIELLTQLARPDVAVITMIGEAHIERLGSREEIARAKSEILSGLKPGGLFVRPGIEPLLDLVLPEMAKPERMDTMTFGRSEASDLYATDIAVHSEYTEFRLHGQEKELRFRIPVLGEHNVTNALAAIAVGRRFGLSWEQLARGLAALPQASMRIEPIAGTNGATLLNDAYNASPSSTRAALRLVEGLAGYQRKLVVLGDMLELGDQEVAFHRQIGEELRPDAIDHVYTFGRLGRFIAEAAESRYAPGHVRAYDDKAALIAELRSELQPGDLVLVKGSRGMKLEEVVQALLPMQN